MGHKICVLGINSFGEPYNQKEYPYPIWGGDKGGPEQIYGYNKLWPIEESFQPDIIFFLNDPWVIDEYMKRVPPNWPRAKVTKFVAYYPTDAGPMHKEWLDLLGRFDAQVCYSKFAERIITESNDGVRPKNLHQIYHGVDTSVFRPIPMPLAKEKLSIHPDTFVVGMVARNQPRKRFDVLVQGFAEFAKNKDNVKLYLHTALNDVGFSILNLCKQFNIEDKITVTRNITPIGGVSNETLNIIYNSFNVNCLISLGDGFGLPVAESMAVGAPQVVSGHSCLQELVEGHGGLTVKTAAWLMNSGGFNTWGGLSDYKDLAEKLETIYQSEELQKQLSIEAYQFIHQEHFTWDFAAKEFDNIFKDILHIYRGERRRIDDVAAFTRPAGISS
jgi:glycosyltransferase involved in cell wall biosynthesis